MLICPSLYFSSASFSAFSSSFSVRGAGGSFSGCFSGRAFPFVSAFLNSMKREQSISVVPLREPKKRFSNPARVVAVRFRGQGFMVKRSFFQLEPEPFIRINTACIAESFEKQEPRADLRLL